MTYLGHEISQALKSLLQNALTQLCPFLSLKKMQPRVFLGAAGYCHQWLLTFVAFANPLYALPTILPQSPFPGAHPPSVKALISFEALK